MDNSIDIKNLPILNNTVMEALGVPGNDGKNAGCLPLHTSADCNLKWNAVSTILK